MKNELFSPPLSAGKKTPPLIYMPRPPLLQEQWDNQVFWIFKLLIWVVWIMQVESEACWNSDFQFKKNEFLNYNIFLIFFFLRTQL